jgi:hypothetical protein
MKRPVVLVRTDIDWFEMTYNKYVNAPQADGTYHTYCMHEKRKERFIEDIKQWDKTFAISYFEFRHTLQQIALKSIEGARLEVVRGVNKIEDLLARSGDFWIIPIDDDDWLSPKVARLSRRRRFTVISWNVHQFQSYRMKFMRQKLRFSTNASALRKSNLMNFSLPEIKYALSYHGRGVTSIIIKSKGGYKNVPHIKQKLGIIVRHPACLSFNSHISPYAIYNFKPYAIYNFKKMQLPHDAVWAISYIKQLKELYAKMLK